ncbi:MAG: hypothetical protein RI897_1143 [Verrucomicrobiota bacterium]
MHLPALLLISFLCLGTTGLTPLAQGQSDPKSQLRAERYAVFQNDAAEWQAKADTALAEGRPFTRPEADDTAWPEMQLPTQWEQAGLPGLDGLVWFRKTVELSSAWNDQPAVLSLGPIDDADITWVNGTRVGSTTGPDQHDTPREYNLPAGLLQPGTNLITVLVMDYRRNGGIHGRPNQMLLSLNNPAQPDIVPLAGTWRYQVGAALPPKPEPPGSGGKEQDFDVNYDEDLIHPYQLPPLLVTAEGKPVTTAEEWMNVRRPQILSLFSHLIYGSVPQPPSALETQYSVIQTDPVFMNGRATRKDISIRFSTINGSAEMLVLVYIPNHTTAPAPAFMIHSFDNTRSAGFDAHPTYPDVLRNGWPLGRFFEAGFGFVVVYQQDLVAHNEVEFRNSIHRLFYRTDQSFPKASEWGVLGAMAWGASRALDYLETDAGLEAARIAIMGHSKCGKAALWTAAQDQRFAMAVSAQSGCAGAALWRRKSGETLDKMVTRFPYWLCRNAWKFVGQEDDLPVDQHMLLACIAPRPVYVHSANGDTWADPRGEYLSAYHASEVYTLLGKKGLTSPESPEPGQPIMESDVGYHTREGGHSINGYDWERFIEFGKHHLK